MKNPVWTALLLTTTIGTFQFLSTLPTTAQTKIKSGQTRSEHATPGATIKSSKPQSDAKLEIGTLKAGASEVLAKEPITPTNTLKRR